MRISRRNLQRLVERYLLNEQDVNTGETKSKEAYEALEKELLEPGFSMNGFVLKFFNIKENSKILSTLGKQLEDNVYLKFIDTASRPIKLKAFIPNDEDSLITPGGSDENASKEWEAEELTEIKSDFTDEEIKEIINELSNAVIDFREIQSIAAERSHVFSANATENEQKRRVYGYYQPPAGYEGEEEPDAIYLNEFLEGREVKFLLRRPFKFTFSENANGVFVTEKVSGGDDIKYELYYSSDYEERVKKLKDIKIETLSGINYAGTAGNGNKSTALEKVLNIDLEKFVKIPSSQIDDQDGQDDQDNDQSFDIDLTKLVGIYNTPGTLIDGDGNTIDYAGFKISIDGESLEEQSQVNVDNELTITYFDSDNKDVYYDSLNSDTYDRIVNELPYEAVEAFNDKTKDPESERYEFKSAAEIKNILKVGNTINISPNKDSVAKTSKMWYYNQTPQLGPSGWIAYNLNNEQNMKRFISHKSFKVLRTESDGSYLIQSTANPSFCYVIAKTELEALASKSDSTSSTGTKPEPTRSTEPELTRSGEGSQSRGAKKTGKATDWDSYISKTKDKENAEIIKLLWQGVEDRAASAGEAAGKTTSYKDFVRWYITLYKTGSIKAGYKIQPGTQIGAGKAWNPGQHLTPKQVQMILRQLSSGDYKTSGLAKQGSVNESLSRGALYRKRYYGRY